MTQRRPAEMQGKITEEGIARMRARIGVLIPQPEPFNTVASLDTIRHYAHGTGDDNPLFTDPAYAEKTRWGGVIAPPIYVQTMGATTVKEIPPEIRKKGEGALTGVPNYHSGGSWEWFRPIYPGDTLFQKYFFSDVQEKRSEFGGGRAVVVYHRREYTNRAGELVVLNTNYFFHVEREASQKTGKNKDIPAAHYTDEELDEIDRAYQNEFRRGSQVLYWEDVKESEEMPVMVRGPLTATDVISHHVGAGWGGFRVAPLRLGYLNRKRVPAFYTKNQYGSWDVAQRVHWDDLRAQAVGNPRSYDYGRMRTTWATQFCTNWMGDSGWLWKLSDQIRKFNFHGDTTWFKGKVKAKRVEDKRCTVEVEIWGENQRKEVTAPAQATIILPSREHGPVVLPGQSNASVATIAGLYGA